MHRIQFNNSSQTKRLGQIRNKFSEALNEVSPETTCTYYDFLMVAKQLSFRFQQASHLMALKNFFSKSGNILQKKKLAELLILNVSAQSEASSDKTIIKFALNDHHSTFQPIQEMTNEDEEYYQSERQSHTKPKVLSEQTSTEKDFGEYYNTVDFKEKIEVIVSMKMHQMVKKIDLIGRTLKDANPFEGVKEQITYPVFKKIVMKIFNFNYERIKISQDDIKTLFFLLDTDKKSSLTNEDLNALKNPVQFFVDLKQFYKFRINPELIKNTELKRGKFGSNTVQVFQLKNPSILELRQIESVLTEGTEMKRGVPVPNTKPRFGPLRHSYARRKSSPTATDFRSFKRHPSTQILNQKGKIQQIVKASKQKKKQKGDSSQTITSRLRRLFIHKVILPRERMLDEEKQLEKKNQKNTSNLQVRSDRI